MKKLQIYLLVLLSALFAGCDTEGEFLDKSYYNPQVTFNPIELQGNYRITYNGSESPYISKSEKTFKLEVFKKDDATNTPVLTENECPSDKAITLGQAVGSELVIYDEAKYTTFTPIIIFSGNEEKYSITFNNSEIKTRIAYYIAKDNLTGTFRIVRKADNTMLYEEEITLEANGTLQLMQLSDTEFLEIPESNEPDPESKRYTKMRFFYTADAFPDVETITMVLYSTPDWNAYDQQVSFDLSVGQLSEYVIFDYEYNGQSVQGLVYDLINKATGEKIVNNEVDIETYIQYNTLLKFQTFRITDRSGGQGGNNVEVSINQDLSTPWE